MGKRFRRYAVSSFKGESVHMNIALLLSGGIGERLDSKIPKQYLKICGRPIILYCLESLYAHKGIHGIQIVAAPIWQKKIRGWMETIDTKGKFKGFSIPGSTRQLSILHGLEDIYKYAGESDIVLIHDAVRPILTEGQVTACLDASLEHEGAVPVLPMKDTVYRSRDRRMITELLNRDEIYAGQAPEAFHLGKYLKANRKLLPKRILQINGSTEPAVIAGMDIAMIPGNENNFKITTRADLEHFQRIEEQRLKNGAG